MSVAVPSTTSPRSPLSRSGLPVVVIGAGPVGVAAAAHLVARGEIPLVLEAGDTVGASVRAWGHVRLFSPWRYVVDRVAVDLLTATGWRAPAPERLPTGDELVTEYLEPLAALPQIRPHLRLGTRVLSVARRGFDKMKSAGREDAPFVVRVRGADGREEDLLAQAVIDASGTYTRANPLGATGVPATGEAALAERIFYGLPDVRGALRARYAGKRVLVVGSGHSAFNVLLDLAALAEEAPGTEITWAVRRPLGRLGRLFGGEADDALPARGALGERVRRLVEAERVRLVSLRITALESGPSGVLVHGDGAEVPPVDEIVAATGFRPDLSVTSELRLELDPAVEAPRALGPLIDPNVHSCGTVPPHGAGELQHPEPDFYVVGMKSYGRAPTFLLLTGYEQVRSVVAALTGDDAGARAVELVLPETGVCSVRSSDADADDGDCGGDEGDEGAVGAPTRDVVVARPTPVAAGAPVAVGQAAGAACCG